MIDDLDKAFERVREALGFDPNIQEKRLAQALFHFWQLFNLLNQRMENAKSYQDRSIIINKFADFHDEFIEKKSIMLKRLNVSEEDVVAHEPKESHIPPELKMSMQMLKNEKDKFYKHFRGFLAEQNGQKDKKAAPKNLRKSEKWLRS